jgi:hypothetical protein
MSIFNTNFFQESRGTKKQSLAFEGITLQQSPDGKALTEYEEGLRIVPIAKCAR